MQLTQQYLDDLMVRMAHHSTAIEGNTLTQWETTQILMKNYVPRAMNMNEVYEVANYKEFMQYLMEHYKEPITPNTVKDVHRVLMQNIIDDNGAYKKIPNIVLGASFIPVKPYEVPVAIQRWCDDLQYRLDNALEERDKVFSIMEQHLNFEHIHPFSDGNGRTGRSLIILACLNQDLVPIVIEKEQKAEYIELLDKADINGLCEMALLLQKKERERMAIFKEIETKKKNDITFPESSKSKEQGLER